MQQHEQILQLTGNQELNLIILDEDGEEILITLRPLELLRLDEDAIVKLRHKLGSNFEKFFKFVDHKDWKSLGF